MFSPPFTAAARILATLAILVSFVPRSSACCCVTSSSTAQAAGHTGESCQTAAAKQCRSHQIAASCCCCGAKGACTCGKSSRSACCQCKSQEAADQSGPYVPTPHAPVRSHHDVDLSYSVPVVVPATAASFALAFSLTPEAVLDHAPPSIQSLLQVWRN